MPLLPLLNLSRALPKPYLSLPKPPSLLSSSPPMAKTPAESDVGISCFVSSLPGFSGVLKKRYADFIVREVDCDGKITRLTSFDVPDEDVEEKEGDISGFSSSSHAEEVESFRSLAGEVDAGKLERFLEDIKTNAKERSSFIVLSPDSDKAHRAEVHNFFKKNFKFLITDTVEESDGLKCIRVRFCLEDGGGRGKGRKRKAKGEQTLDDGRPFDSRGSDSWPENRGKFLRFHLCKENKDTQEALGVIAKMLGLQIRSFGFAGTKDKRAVSTQRVTVFKVHAKKLAALNSRLFGIKLGDFSYVREGLLLGQLLGNHFTIILRGVVAESEETVKAAADGLGKNGFINYYGLQRFGSGSVPTHSVGAALLRGEWKVAVDLILDPRDGERFEVTQVREYLKETGDIDGTLRKLPRYLVAERSILQCLKKCSGNYLQALRAIPRTLRMMYVHSYQSYLWNHTASARVQKYGTDKVILGDLVFQKDRSEKCMVSDYVQLQDSTTEDSNDCGIDESLEPVIPDEHDLPVKVINADDLLEGCYTFEDVVLPLPGSRVIYPENDVADIYGKLAEKDGISLSECAHGAKEFSLTSLTGGYRKVFQRPMDFTWELINYTDVSIPLAETDFDATSQTEALGAAKMQKTMARCCNQQTSNGSEEKDSVCSSVPVDGGPVSASCSSDVQKPLLALKLAFTLPTSCYATMAIRELLKSSTSVAFQKSLNV